MYESRVFRCFCTLFIDYIQYVPEADLLVVLILLGPVRTLLQLGLRSRLAIAGVGVILARLEWC